MDKPISYLEEILQTLYDSEINASISWLWDGGIDDKDCDNDFDHSRYRYAAQALSGCDGPV